MAFVTALMNSLITILLSYTSGPRVARVCRCVWHLLVLSSDKHTQTVIASCLGLCQESWWQQERKIDGLLCQHTSLIVSLSPVSLTSSVSLPLNMYRHTCSFFLLPTVTLLSYSSFLLPFPPPLSSSAPLSFALSFFLSFVLRCPPFLSCLYISFSVYFHWLDRLGSWGLSWRACGFVKCLWEHMGICECLIMETSMVITEMAL